MLMKMNRDDRRAHEPVRAEDESDPTIDDEQSAEEPPPRAIRLGAAWRLPVILAAADLDDELPEER